MGGGTSQEMVERALKIAAPEVKAEVRWTLLVPASRREETEGMRETESIVYYDEQSEAAMSIKSWYRLGFVWGGS